MHYFRPGPLVTVVFTGDATDVTGGSGYYNNAVGTTTVTVTGVGAATFTDSMSVFDVQGNHPYGGVSDDTKGGSVLIDTSNPTFHSMI